MTGRFSGWIMALIAALAYVCSTGAALYLSRKEWLPEKPPPTARIHIGSSSKGEAQSDVHRESIRMLSEELSARLESLAERENELEAYAELLEQERQELEKMQERIVAERERIDALVTVVQASEEKHTKRLASVYSEMRPEEAIQILDEMDDESVLGILREMKNDRLMSVFSAWLQEPPRAGDAVSPAERVAWLSRRLGRVVDETTVQEAVGQ